MENIWQAITAVGTLITGIAALIAVFRKPPEK
jgi:hypothetical protein